MRKGKLRTAAVLLSGIMAAAPFASVPMTGMAAESSEYVLMNIPYETFYQAEGYNGPAVDAVTSATKVKTRAITLTGGSYHQNADGSDISGVVYPVKVSNLSELTASSKYKKISSTDSLNYTVSLRGQETPVNLTGKDTLFCNPDYAYYVLDDKDKPAKFLNAVVSDGAVVIQKSSDSELQADERIQGVTGEVTYNGRHADTEIKLSGVKESGNISGIILTYTKNGTNETGTLALKHLDNIWRGTEIGFGKDQINDATITNIRYITTDAVRDYPVSIKVNPYYDGQVTAALNTADEAKAAKEDEITLGNLPADIKNPIAKVYYSTTTNGRTTNTTAAENIAVKDGVVKLGGFLDRSREYTVEVSSDNYAAIKSGKTAAVKFTDVENAGRYFFTPVYWAVDHKPVQITDGTSDTTFSPYRNCSREDFVTFLWRYAGSPEPTISQVPFRDLDATKYSYKAILWAYEKGITEGVDTTTFAPGKEVRRGEVMEFLYRYDGKHKTDKASAFTDTAGRFCADAVDWAADEKITDGTSDTTFSPDANCKRGEVVSFLYRYDQAK